MATRTKPIPEGFRAITPSLTIRGAEAAIAFYRAAFGAVEQYRMTAPESGTILHARLLVGDASLWLADEFPDYGAVGPESLGGSPVTLHLFVEDVDAAFDHAVAAGASALMPPTDMFWGDRFAKLRDPFGHLWSIATRAGPLTPEQPAERTATAFPAPTAADG